MQLGARWRTGDAPHRGVPEALHAAIAESEGEHPAGSAWTLTWLESRPRVELFDAEGERLDDLRVDASGQVSRRKIYPADSADETSDSAENSGDDSGDDDDDWLK